MPRHLPLSPIDQVNRPSIDYLQVQDGLIALGGLLWTIAYCLYVRQAFRDRSYGMPLLSLYVQSYLAAQSSRNINNIGKDCSRSQRGGTHRWANVAWEFLFGVIFPVSFAWTVVLLLWLVVDVGIVFTTWRFGPKQWEKQAPWIGRHMGSIVLGGILLMTVLYWAVAKIVGADAASFYLAYVNQLLLGVSSVTQLLSRGNTSGHSFGIW